MQTQRNQHAGQPSSTRRTFLKASAAAVSAVAASRLVVPQYVHAAGSRGDPHRHDRLRRTLQRRGAARP